jgi:hypothetical protein
LLVTANVVLSSPILVTLMMEELRSSETSVLKRATRRNIPDGGVFFFDSVYSSENFQLINKHFISYYSEPVYTVVSQMAVRLSALCASRRFTPQKHYFSACVNHFC